MFHYGIIALIIALVAALLGFAVLAGTAAWIAKILFMAGIVIFVISLITGKKPSI